MIGVDRFNPFGWQAQRRTLKQSCLERMVCEQAQFYWLTRTVRDEMRALRERACRVRKEPLESITCCLTLSLARMGMVKRSTYRASPCDYILRIETREETTNSFFLTVLRPPFASQTKHSVRVDAENERESGHLTDIAGRKLEKLEKNWRFRGNGSW